MPITEILSEDQRRKRVWRRVMYLVLFILLAVFAIVLSFDYRSGHMDTYQSWIENYGDRLLDNYEPLLVQAITGSKTEVKGSNKNYQSDTVRLVIETLQKQPVVIEASLFDATGTPVLKQVEAPAAQLLSHYSSSSPQIFIRELYSPESPDGDIIAQKQKHLGYLRIILDRQFIIKQNAKISQSDWQLILIITAIALVSGMVIGSRFVKWRLRV